MNKNILITIKKELRGIVRDKKSLMMMLVGPIMIPIFIFLFSYVYDSISKKEEEQYTIGVNYELNDAEKDIVKELNLDEKIYEVALMISGGKVTERQLEYAKEMILNKE